MVWKSEVTAGLGVHTPLPTFIWPQAYTDLYPVATINLRHSLRPPSMSKKTTKGPATCRPQPFKCHLFEVRVSKELTAMELADIAGVSEGVVLRCEWGHGTTLGSAIRIARALGMAVEEIWEPKRRG